MSDLRIDAQQLASLCRAVLEAANVPADAAELATTAIVEADLRGTPSHGVRLLPGYIDRIQGGGINPRPNIHVIQEGPAFALLDGDNGMGHVIAAHAMDLAIEKARACGIGACAARQSGHFGIAAFYSLRAAEQGMIGLATTNSVAAIPPPGGRVGLVGNTATSYALPAAAEPPLVLDIAMSAAARAKIALYAERGEPLPENWALDVDGKPTTDAQEALTGWLLPMAGYKGFGLALFWDALAGVLSGARFGRQVVRAAPNEVSDVGHFMLAIDIAQFGDPATFRERIDTVIRDIRDAPRQPGVDELHAPGQHSHARRTRHLAEGVPLPAATVERLNQLAADRGVDLRLRPNGTGEGTD